MHEFIVSVVAFVVLLGLMVAVHEFGHFAVAKLCKVRVEAFSIGFGPRLIGFTYGETEYKICILPLGGYVKMSGENFAEVSDAAAGEATVAPADDPGSFTAHPRWQRVLIGLAGPVANFVLAFALMFFYYGAINEVPANEIKQTVIDWVNPDSPAAQAGIEPGDLVRSVASADQPDWQKFEEILAINPNQTVPLVVERAGHLVSLHLHIPAEIKGDDLVGMLPQFTSDLITVKDVQPGNPADQAGMRNGDLIQSVDGHSFHSVLPLLAYMKVGEGKPISLVVVRNGTPLTLVAHPAKLDDGWKLGFAPLPPPARNEPMSLEKAAVKSTKFCADGSTMLLQVLQRVASRKVSAGHVFSGPVGIARVAGDAAETKDWFSKFYLAGQISISLGVLNLLPFPILDGGMILFLLIEGALRRDINMAVKERIYQVAFYLLIAFFAFTVFNDVSKLPFFLHLKP